MAGRHTISRRVTFPLSQANRRRQAALVIERGELRMLHSKDKARDYLYRNAEAIMEAFGSAHKLKKEDVSLAQKVAGTLADESGSSLSSLSAACMSMPGRSWSPTTTCIRESS